MPTLALTSGPVDAIQLNPLMTEAGALPVGGAAQRFILAAAHEEFIMPILSKNDLRFSYQWSTYRQDDPRVTGEPDSTLLNREEGYEVLYFVNRFCDKQKWTPAPATKDTALKVERMIKEHLPGNIRARENIYRWIVDNWAQHA